MTVSLLAALFCGGWLAFAIWVGWPRHGRGTGKAAWADTARLLDASPYACLLRHGDGRVEWVGGAGLFSGAGDEVERVSALLGDGGWRSLLDHASAASIAGPSVVDVEDAGGAHTYRAALRPVPSAAGAGGLLIWISDVTGEAARQAEQENKSARLSGALDALTALLEAAPFPIWHRGPDLRLAMVNGAYVQAVEAQSAIDVIRSGTELADDGGGRLALGEAAMVMQAGKPATRVLPATIAGERRMVQVTEVPAGTGVAGYAIDVEALEQARADLARFTAAQRDMLDRLSAGVAQFGRDRGLAFVNGPFMRLFGLAPDLIADQPEFDRLLDRMRERRGLPEVRDFPEWKGERRGWFLSDQAVEEDWLLPDGRHIRVVAQPLPDGGLLLIFEDRTEQNQLASARDTLLRVRTATFDNLFEAIGVFASDGRLHLWNKRFQEVWGVAEEALAAHPRIDALVPRIALRLSRPERAGGVRELVRSATVERKQRNGRVSFADGREFAFAAVPLPDGNALFTMLDVTDSRRIEAALRDRNEALEAADRVKTAFVANMSYELRTPLTSISGYAEMLAGGYAGALSATAADYVAAINESVGRLGGLVDNVLDLTQSDTGGLLLAEEQVEVRALCAGAAAREADAAAGKDIVISLAVDSSAGEIVGDRRRLEQAVGNVLKNAVGFTQAGGRVLVHAAGTSRGVEIVISDNGPGIAADEQGRVFDRFQRAGGRVDGAHAALGLGLPLARQFVEEHGGSLALESEIGQGTSVTFFLPRSRK